MPHISECLRLIAVHATSIGALLKCLPLAAGGTSLDFGELDALVEVSTGLSEEELRLLADILQAGVVHALQLCLMAGTALH